MHASRLGCAILVALQLSCGARTGLDAAPATRVCPQGFATCAADPAGSCETDLASSSANCGSCGHACSGGLVCGAGACRSGSEIVQVVAGTFFSCIRRASGSVECWGVEFYGADPAFGDELSPTPVSGLNDAVELTACGPTACARRADGTVVCWGNNHFGQLGDGTTQDQQSPVQVVGLREVAHVASFCEATCALQRSGTEVCWGRNGACGFLGDGTNQDRTHPAPVSGLSNLFAIGGTCAVEGTGGVVCWGANDADELGNGTNPQPVPGDPCMTYPDDHSTIPVRVSGIADASAVTYRYETVCTVRRGGALACWGDNQYGLLGVDGSSERTSDVPVVVPGIDDAVEVGLGQYHACARRAGGRVACWGANLGEAPGWVDLLGYDPPPPFESTVPEDVPDLEGVISIGVEVDHSCAVVSDGSVWCWGFNGFGQLGDGTAEKRLNPVRVVGL